MVEKNSGIINIRMELELDGLENIRQTFGTIENGRTIQIYNEEAELKIISSDDLLSFDGGTIIEFMLTFSVNVAAGVIGNYIYNLCKNGKKLTLNNRRTRIKEETIKQALIQNIDSKSTSSTDIRNSTNQNVKK